ncbi:GNAT family N-acetyltransferase [Bacillus sp. ISL-41]|uniref:GNAT family N-acetyltransferase n=1 Tax=Bacillus sp. ISL-41 TaxID=2819127 RepID=UPI001BEB17ED|nr:GNAT family N-acetyltransferase [Bacillus sp. ISL-41]MBT2641509.1 GNAT family N-acetyltransferase [Bacillus sp. ISL-41]
MKFLEIAQFIDLDEIVKIDEEVIGSSRRYEFIRNAIEDERCIVVKDKNLMVGFLIFDIHFFDSSFISLIIIKPTERRKGYATSLIEYFTSKSPTQKIFSSTNKSNHIMQEVFKANGFIQSGFIENLEEDDPEIIYFKSL